MMTDIETDIYGLFMALIVALVILSPIFIPLYLRENTSILDTEEEIREHESVKKFLTEERSEAYYKMWENKYCNKYCEVRTLNDTKEVEYYKWLENK